MTWRSDHKRQAGFTLIEMVVVLVILALIAGLIVGRGPWRSRGLTARGAAGEVAGALRAARGQAIATNQPVAVAFDLATKSFHIGAEAPRRLPPDLGLSVWTTTGEVQGPADAAIRFEPDGSSNGGRVELGKGPHHLAVGVDWLTGRVSVADVP